MIPCCKGGQHKQRNKLKTVHNGFSSLQSGCTVSLKSQHSRHLNSLFVHTSRWINKISLQSTLTIWVSTLLIVLGMLSSLLVPVVSWCQQKPSLCQGCISLGFLGTQTMCPYSRWYPSTYWHLCKQTLVTAQFFVQLVHEDWGLFYACHLLLQYGTGHTSERKPSFPFLHHRPELPSFNVSGNGPRRCDPYPCRRRKGDWSLQMRDLYVVR